MILTRDERGRISSVRFEGDEGVAVWVTATLFGMVLLIGGCAVLGQIFQLLK